MVLDLPGSILSIVCPQACDICEGEVWSLRSGTICSDCWASTRIFNGNETLCGKCGAFLFDASSMKAIFCQGCDKHFYDLALAVGVYHKALSASVIRLKHTPYIPRLLRDLLFERAEQISIDDSTVVIPVPLSDRRLRERGFNQAALIAKTISSATRLPVDERTLRRRVHTQIHRAGMDRKARAITVKNAFEVVRPAVTESRNILLIDDVMTSGETVSMCAKALKESGAATVTVLTIARAA